MSSSQNNSNSNSSSSSSSSSSSVARYFDTMDYGPAPESDTDARQWLARHA